MECMSSTDTRTTTLGKLTYPFARGELNNFRKVLIVGKKAIVSRPVSEVSKSVVVWFVGQCCCCCC